MVCYSYSKASCQVLCHAAVEAQDGVHTPAAVVLGPRLLFMATRRAGTNSQQLHVTAGR